MAQSSHVLKYGPARVGLALMAGSAVFAIFPSTRGVWGTGLELVPALVMMAYMALREFGQQDPLARFWWAGPVASLYLVLWGISSLGLALGSLAFLAGAFLLAYATLWPLRDWAGSMGFDWRYSLYGYRRAVLIGASVAFLALFLTWIPEVRTSGYFSGGYSYRYSSYYDQNTYQWDSLKNYNPGLYFAASRGIGLRGAVLMELGLLACFVWAALAPQYAVPRWYRYLPFIVLGYGLLYLLAAGSLALGQLFFALGAGLIGWGSYQLAIRGVAQGPGDLRQIPLDRLLRKWL